MDNSTLIIAVLLGVIQIVLIFAVLQTAQNTKEANNYLKHINIKLNDIQKAVTENSTATEKRNEPPTESKQFHTWICSCGKENYNSNGICVKCGAKEK